MKSQIRPAVVSLILLTVLTGVIYPAAVTVIANVVFPRQAHGSLIVRNATTVGSELIGQPFSDPKYFWGRPTVANPLTASGSNLAPSNPALTDAIKARIDALKSADPENDSPVPI